MSHSNTAFHQLLKPLSRHEFEAEAKKHHVGQKLRSATRWDQFVGMAMSQLSDRQSPRDIQSNLEAQQDKLYHLDAKPIARSTMPERSIYRSRYFPELRIAITQQTLN